MRAVAKRYAKALAIFCKEKGIDYEETYKYLTTLRDNLLSDEKFF